MSDEDEDDPLAGILGNELGEWDKIFDSLDEEVEADVSTSEAASPAPSSLEAEQAVAAEAPVSEVDDSSASAASEEDRRAFFEDDPLAETALPSDGLVLEILADPPALDGSDLSVNSPFYDEAAGVALGPPGAVQPDAAMSDVGQSREIPGADDEVNFGGVPEALGTLLGSGGHEELELEIGAPPSVPALRIGDVALADLLGDEPVPSAKEDIARISERANAFFDDSSAREVSLELDVDSYDGIEVSGSTIPTPVPEDEPIESAAFAAPGSQVPEGDEGVGGAGASEGNVPSAGSAPAESDGVPIPILDPGREALRTGAIPEGTEESEELASEVDGALESMRSGPSTPASGDARSDSAAPPIKAAKDGVIDDGVIRDRAPRLDGVVEAAVEDAVAMSTGTLHTGPQLLEADVEPDLPPAKFSDALADLDLARIHVPDRVEAEVADRTDEAARLLVLYERELDLLDEPGAIVRMRIESGRLAESLGDLDRARRHLDEALKLAPRLVPANRALRRIERRLGNWDQVLAQLDHELQKAGSMEARALSAYRADLLMAMGEPDLARVAVGELLDLAPRDTRALLANLELAFVDGREDEVQSSLAALAESLSGTRLRSAICALSGTIATQKGDAEKAAEFFGEATKAWPNIGAEFFHAAVRYESSDSEEYSGLVAQVASKSPDLGAGLAWLRAESLLAKGQSEDARTLLRDALKRMPDDALLLDCSLRAGADASNAGLYWQQLGAATEDAVAAAGAYRQSMHFALQAEGEPAAVLALANAAHSANPSDMLASAWVRRLGGSTSNAASANDGKPPTDIAGALALARELEEAGEMAAARAAIEPMIFASDSSLSSLIPLALDLARSAGDTTALATYHAMVATVARDTGSNEVACQASRSAARALTVIAGQSPGEQETQRLAMQAWASHSELEPGVAAEAALLLASRGGDSNAVEECSSLAGEQVRHASRKAQLAIAKAGASLVADASASADALSVLLQEGSDPRAAELSWAICLSTERLTEAAEVLETEARRGQGGPLADRHGYRAAYLRVQHDLDLDLAVQLLTELATARPQFTAAGELLRTARGHGGVALASEGAGRPRMSAASLPQDSISGAIRHIESLARAGTLDDAAERSGELRKKYPDDALVQHAFGRHCWLAGASADLTEKALADLRDAEERSDGEAKAVACEELARIDLELRGDRESARMFWESGSKAAPLRADLQRVLESEYRGHDAQRERYKVVCGRVIASLEGGSERSAYLVARARLSKALGREASVVRGDYEGALEDDPLCREALFFLESEASLAGPTEELASLEVKASAYFAGDPRAQGAFLVRSGETWRSLGQRESCLARLKGALKVVPGFTPALSAWRDLALDHELWAELAEACLLEVESVESDEARAQLFLLAGVTLMDRVEDGTAAIAALRSVLVVEPLSREAFVRLRLLYDSEDRDEDLAQLYSMRLEAQPEDPHERCELHLALARVLWGALENPLEALVHYRALLALRANDKEAIVAVSEITWATKKWADAADALMVLARIETDTTELASVFGRLGTIYAEHLPQPQWALKSFHKMVTLDPGNHEALRHISVLGVECGEYRLALGACEQIIKQAPPVAERIEVLIHMAKILRENTGDPKNSKRALRHALDLDPGSDAALDALVQFYVDQNDLRSARIHVDRVANAMRKRIQESAADGEAYRVLARAMAAKAKAGAAECMPTAQVAASLALRLGVENSETSSLAKQVGPGMAAGLADDTFDDLLFTHSVPGEARTLFALLGGRLAKHIGIDVRSHGVGRNDRLRKGIDDAASVILKLADEMGVEDVDIYVSKQKPNLLAVEPTSPFSIILGEELASAERLGELRFFVGRSLKGASASLSAPLQLGVERFGVLLVGLLRQFQPEFAPTGVDTEAASAEQQRLRRLIPSSLLQELQPYALGLVTGDFDHKAIWQAMADACNRVGLLCAGDGSAAIAGLMRAKGHSDLRKALQDPEIASLVRFACSGEHARLWAALRA
ncbi:MAG: hypothetical protein GY811_12885 [Myxococcales bacterium]|nr:hypothetical protein [Myxococcales bacterium]